MSAVARLKPVSLESVYESLHKLLSSHAPPLKTHGGKVPGKKDLHLTIPKAVVVPGAYGDKPTEVALASIILQKGYVGFYFMPIYVNPGLKKKLSPALLGLLKGKTCFYVKRLDANLLKDIKAALKLGVECYQDRGWL